jgi:hypothetical protein
MRPNPRKSFGETGRWAMTLERMLSLEFVRNIPSVANVAKAPLEQKSTDGFLMVAAITLSVHANDT